MTDKPLQIDKALSRKFANMSVIAAFMVVLHAGGVATIGSSGWWLQRLLSQVCKAAVPFFFLASGFFGVGHWGEAGWYRQVVSKRVRTLVLPYFIWCVLWCCYFIPVCCRHGGLTDFLSVHTWAFLGVDVLRPPFYSVAWYLRALFFFVLMSPALVAFVRRCKWWCVGLLYLADLVFRIASGSAGGIVFGIFHYVFSLEGAAYFVMGIGLRLGVLVRPQLPKLSVLVAMMAALLVVNTSLYWMGTLPWMALEGFVIPIVIAVLWSLTPDADWPSWMTTASFPLYMIHPFALALLTSFVFRTTDNAVFLVLKVVAAIAISMVAISLFRRLMPRVAPVMFGGR